MPAPVVLILAAGRGECFLASGGNTHKCIGWRQSPEVAPYRWPFEENGRTFDLAIEPQITTNDLRLMLRLALAGGGITIATQETFRPYIESGKLVSLLDDFLPQFPGFYLYFPQRRNIAPKLRALIDYVKEWRQRKEATVRPSGPEMIQDEIPPSKPLLRLILLIPGEKEGMIQDKIVLQRLTGRTFAAHG